jgi:cell division septal protein FtsQ
MYNTRYKKASSRISRRSRLRRIFNLFLKITIPTALVVGLFFLLRADFLQVKNWQVVGAGAIPQESIKNTASNFILGDYLFIIPKSNILFLNEGKLSSVLLSQFGRLQKAEVSKNYFSGDIIIKILERQADFLWCSETQCFFMTKDGFVFEQTESSTTDKIIFYGLLTGNPLMKNFATAAKMKNYVIFIGVLKDAGFDVSSINIESLDRATASSNMGDIIFNPEETNLTAVAQNVILIINNTLTKKPSARFDYIDARFGNKVYYKLY